MKNEMRLYERLDLPVTTETFGSLVLRFFKALGLAILCFVVLMLIMAGIMQLGWNLGWNHNSIFLACTRGAMIGALGGSIHTFREMFKCK